MQPGAPNQSVNPTPLQRVFRSLWAGLRRIPCSLNLHTWSNFAQGVDYCSRPGCLAARKRVPGRWHTFTRKEVTVEDVQKLNRHERRRLGSLARRGAFGVLPREEAP